MLRRTLAARPLAGDVAAPAGAAGVASAVRRQRHCQASAAAAAASPQPLHAFHRMWPAAAPRWRPQPVQQRERASALPAGTAAATPPGATAAVSAPVLHIAEGLPIRECLADVLLGLDRGSGLVLQAPPGAGKTTVVPLAMLAHEPAYLRGGKRILVLEPRRVAAKGAARRMAATLGEAVGGRVGYRVRLEARVSGATRIEVVTEGILLRRLQSDPELAGVGAVVFDEFHERNLDADVALALCADVQRLARPDLRLVVMSATLGGGLGERVRALLAATAAEAGDGGDGGSGGGDDDGADGIPLVVSEGRSFPVQTHYLGRPENERGGLARAVADGVARALRDGASDGRSDVLAFLPGVGEIRAVQRLLQEEGTDRKHGARVMQLHGNMAPDEQDEVLRPRGGGAAANRQRRVILATPIAESSVTIDGVTAVVDCGLRRAPRYDPSTAIDRLITITISEASAEQRRGRAGRTAPGRCYRLWEERDALPATSDPEIETADLAPTALDLALWGSPDGAGLPWLDPPPADLLAAGRELLQDLGAAEPGSGRPTAHGRTLARLGMHPRWGQAVLRGAVLGCAELAGVVATLLGSERDVLRRAGGGDAARSADIALRLEALARDDPALDRAAARRILQGARSAAAMASVVVAAASKQGGGGGGGRSAGGGGGAVQAAGSSEEEQERALAAALAAAGASPLESGDASEQEEEPEDCEGADERGGVNASRDSAPAPPFSGASRATAAQSAAAFDVAWREQLVREGLVGALVAAAYPDRIAERKDRSNRRAAYTLSTGQVVRLPSEEDPLGRSEYLAVADIGGVGPAWRRDGGGNDVVRAAAGLSAAAVERYLKDMVQERDVVFWASGSKSVLARRQTRLGCLVLAERAVPITDHAALPALLQGFKEMGGVRGVGLSRELEAWRQRAVWLRSQAVDAAGAATAAGAAGKGSSAVAARLAALPDLSDAGLLRTAASWLAPHLVGCRNKADILRLEWSAIIRSLVPRDLSLLVDAEAPSHLTLPTGTRALLDYSGEQPVVRCKLQEVFGQAETPRLAGGRIPLTLELLSPAGRPVAVTSDLGRFWTLSYPEVRKELRGRYPKHVWPDDPLQAEATRLTKKAQEAQEARQAAAAAAAPGHQGGASSPAKSNSGSGKTPPGRSKKR